MKHTELLTIAIVAFFGLSIQQVTAREFISSTGQKMQAEVYSVSGLLLRSKKRK